MANRMDIELTSARDDEFTWRAAGARQPRGSVACSLLPPSSKVGDVLRAEVEVEIDGINVVAILPPKDKPQASDRIEHLGPPRPAAGVTTVLNSRGERRERDGRQRDGRRREARPERRRQPSGERESRPGTARRSARPERNREREDEASRPAQKREAPPSRRGPARFEPGTAHRDELFATLTPEQQPIAERLAIGGLPAVRKAISEEQQRAKQEGRPVLSGEPIVALAEQLLPDVRAAVWLDRAEAAVGRAEEISLRDLRATVVGASPKDEAGRELEHQLRQALEKRVTKLRTDWESHITQAMDQKRVLQALRLSGKPPEPTARFPGALASRLAELAGEAMTEETAPDRWLSLLEASLESPVRRQVKPAGLAKDPSGEVERQARSAASRIPALARLLGMPIPPPPRPGAAAEHRPPSRPRRPFSSGTSRRSAPRPPRREDEATRASRTPPEVSPARAAEPAGESSGVTAGQPETTPEPASTPAEQAVLGTAPVPPEVPAPVPPEVPETVEEQGPAGAGEVKLLGPEEATAAEVESDPVLGEEFDEPLDEAESS